MNRNIVTLTFIIAIITLISCANKNEPLIYIFNDVAFKTLKGEREIKIEKQIQQDYLKYFGDNKIPLFKVIQNNTYVIYLGLPYNLKMMDIVNYVKEKRDSSFTNVTADKHTLTVIRSHNGYSTTECYYKIDSINLLYIASISNGDTNSMANAKKLIQRIVNTR